MVKQIHDQSSRKPRKVELRPSDFISIFWRSSFEQASWNYERMQNLGFAYIMSPAIKRLYPNKSDRISAMKRHLLFFNTSPIMQSLVTGVVLSMEEQRANGGDVDDTEINAVKTAMMGPLGGIGDPLWSGTVRPVLSAFAVSLVIGGFGIYGPILFFVAWNCARLLFRYEAQKIGYQNGTDIINFFNTGILKTVTKATSIFGMFMMGVIVARWVKVNFSITDQLAEQVTKLSGHFFGKLIGSGMTAIAAIGLTLICIWLIRRQISPIWIIIGLFMIGIIGYASGILSIQAFLV